MRRRKAFTVIELIICVGLVLFVGAVITGGVLAYKYFSGTSSEVRFVNPLHAAEVTIKPLVGYFARDEGVSTYRVYARVVKDSDNDLLSPDFCETFEISDSLLDNNYRSADIFGSMLANLNEPFEITTRGERSGIAGGGSFRQITSAEYTSE